MNKVILMGRLTRDPEIRYSQGEQSTAVARYTIAEDSDVTETSRQQILSTVLHLDVRENLQKNISVKGLR